MLSMDSLWIDTDRTLTIPHGFDAGRTTLARCYAFLRLDFGTEKTDFESLRFQILRRFCVRNNHH